MGGLSGFAEATVLKRIKLEYVPIEKLKKWNRNPRVMPQDQEVALYNSLKKFDIVEPLVIDQNNRIVGGHQRLDALIGLDVKLVPCIRKHLSETEFKALNLALNRISGDWDEQKLASILEELKELPEINLTGFSEKEISKLISENLPNEKPAILENDQYHLEFKTSKEQAEAITMELHRLREKNQEDLSEGWRERNLTRMAGNSAKSA